MEGRLFAGEALTDHTKWRAYATDRSVYKEMPLTVVIPKSVKDIRLLIVFERRRKTALMPRAAGTSKALSSQHDLKLMLSVPVNYQAEFTLSGWCGMAELFGHELEDYEVSNNIGELVLFPAVRQLPSDVIVAASSTSCRHQFEDGAGRLALHPIEVLFDALNDN